MPEHSSLLKVTLALSDLGVAQAYTGSLLVIHKNAYYIKVDFPGFARKK
jgi:hypothetical protein